MGDEPTTIFEQDDVELTDVWHRKPVAPARPAWAEGVVPKRQRPKALTPLDVVLLSLERE